MSQRQLQLALTICEWSNAVSHIEAAVETGFIQPRPYTVLGAVRRELRDLLNQWASVTGRLLRTDEDDERMVAEAKAYVDRHI